MKKYTHHGHAKKNQKTKEYLAYHAMIARCYRPNNKEYHRYGGRGISVCNRWLGQFGFINFLADMGDAPSQTHTLDRKANNKNYTPSNCRWATVREQLVNRRNSVHYENRPMVEWAELHNLNYHTLMDRWRRGDRGERLFRPVIGQETKGFIPRHSGEVVLR